MTISSTALIRSFIGILAILSASAAYVAYNKLATHVEAAEKAAQAAELRLSDLASKIEIRAEKSQGRLPFVTLTVAPDHTVRRSVIESEFAKAITWNILRDGEQVLGRNAQNETEYKHFDNKPGFYTIYVTAFIDGAYRIISNVVFYKIEPHTEPEATPR